MVDAAFTLPDFLAGVPDSAKSAHLRDRLAGNWRLVEVFTEGVGLGRVITESRLVIQARPRVDTAARIGYQRNIIADAVGDMIRSGDPKLPLKRVRGDSGRFYLTVNYFVPDRLELRPGDPRHMDLILNDDPRLYYQVMEVGDSGTISGRFASGGLGVPQIPSPVGPLAEHPAGYFCAFKEAKAPPSS
jgi:hypothetical protein